MERPSQRSLSKMEGYGIHDSDVGDVFEEEW
jgi:hypothetical protein